MKMLKLTLNHKYPVWHTSWQGEAVLVEAIHSIGTYLSFKL